MSTGPALDPAHAAATQADLGVEPLPLTVAPRTAEAVAGVLREDDGGGIVPVGGGTGLGAGAVPQRVGRLLSLRRMDQVREHSAPDFVVTAEAGISWTGLQQAVAAHGQWVPLEPPDADRATLGGMIAGAAGSLLASSRGTLRDSLLGVRLAWPGGAVTQAGGRVVKNVSGYDLMKLVHGSLGTLAVVVEACLRLRPRPARDVVWSAPVDSLTRALELARTAPACLRAEPAALHLCAAEGAAGPLRLVLRLQGAPAAVEAEGERLRQAWRAAALEPAPEDVPADGPRPAVLGLLEGVLSRGDAREVVQSTLRFRPSRLDAVVECHQQLEDAVGAPVPFLIDLPCGRLHARQAAPAAGFDLPRWSAALLRLRDQLAAHGATLVREAAPAALRAQVPAWQRSAVVTQLERRIRQEFDPRGVLSPGRLDWDAP